MITDNVVTINSSNEFGTNTTMLSFGNIATVSRSPSCTISGANLKQGMSTLNCLSTFIGKIYNFVTSQNNRVSRNTFHQVKQWTSQSLLISGLRPAPKTFRSTRATTVQHSISLAHIYLSLRFWLLLLNVQLLFIADYRSTSTQHLNAIFFFKPYCVLPISTPIANLCSSRGITRLPVSSRRG